MKDLGFINGGATDRTTSKARKYVEERTWDKAVDVVEKVLEDLGE